MTGAPLIVESLSMHDLAGREIVSDASLRVEEGEVLAIIGESGSGKTSVALGLLGFARPGMIISKGKILIDGKDILRSTPRELRNHRGNRVSLVPQNPTTSFSPRMRIGRQMAELLLAHGYAADVTLAMIRTALVSVGLPDSDAFLRRYPFELSGGQLQRVAIGMAFITNPRVIVMDEPTTGLDVSTQQTILALIRDLVRTSKASFVYVTHDLAVVNVVADRIAVMLHGKIVETGTRREIFSGPKHDYTRMLLDTIPELPDIRPASAATSEHHQFGEPAAASSAQTSLLEVQDLHIKYGAVEVVHGISFAMRRGECMGLVGGSGSGKTTTGRCIAGLHTQARGRVLFDGTPLAFGLARRRREDLSALQIIFQNPDRSLNPRESVLNAIGRAAALAGGRERKAEVTRLLDRVRLPQRVLSLYPADLSGGERQRVAIARALAMKPRLLICDEITSALDVSVQAAVIDLLMDLKRDGLSMLFITHNLPLVAEMAESIIIMKNGAITESGATERVLTAPRDSYTRMLLEAAPRVDRQPMPIPAL